MNSSLTAVGDGLVAGGDGWQRQVGGAVSFWARVDIIWLVATQIYVYFHPYLGK